MPTDLTELSKRELFAALIAAGMSTGISLACDTGPDGERTRTRIACAAVDLADELIKELAQ